MKYLTWVGFIGDKRRGPAARLGYSISIVTDIKPDTQVNNSHSAIFQKDIYTNDLNGAFAIGDNIGVSYDDLFATLSEAERDVITKVFAI